jgi:hypothetical protein
MTSCCGARFDLDAVGDMAARQLPGPAQIPWPCPAGDHGSCQLHFDALPCQEIAAANQWQAIGYLAGDTPSPNCCCPRRPLLYRAALARRPACRWRIKRLRSTPAAVVLPERIDVEFTDWLQPPHQLVPVVHANQPMNWTAWSRLGQARQAGATAEPVGCAEGVNDSSDVRPSERLFDAGVLPYYHQLDRVQGAAYFSAA